MSEERSPVEEDLCRVLAHWWPDHDKRHLFMEEAFESLVPLWRAWDDDQLTPDQAWYEEAMLLSARYEVPLRVVIEAYIQFSMSAVLWKSSREHAARQLRDLLDPARHQN